MKRSKTVKALPAPRTRAVQLAGTHQGIARPAAILDALAQSASRGLRLTDLVHATGLGKATVHRLLAGLTACRLVEQDLQSSRFFIGSRVLHWAVAAGDKHGILRAAEPAMLRLARETEDTVYLTVREGDEAVCIARRVGSYPIKTLTLEAGDRRPLGVSAGGLALLAFLGDDEIDRILGIQASARIRLPFDHVTMRKLIAGTRRAGHAFYDAPVFHGAEIVTGMAAVAVAIRRGDTPVAALSIAAITSRLDADRRPTVVDRIRVEVRGIEAAIGHPGSIAE